MTDPFADIKAQVESMNLGIVRDSTLDPTTAIVQFAAEPQAAPPVEQADARAPARDERERAAAAIRAMQEALAPHVDALYSTDAGMDVMEAYDHYGRAADALRLSIPGWTGLVLAELTAAAELLRTAAARSAQAAVALNPIATMTEQASAAVETWPTTHAAAEGATAFTSNDARLVLTPIEGGGFVLTDNDAEVARFAAESDAMQAVAAYALPADDPAAGTPFNVFLAPEGVESGDGRLLEIGTVTWRDPPLALMMQDTSSHGPGDPAPAWFAGAIERVYRDPADATRIMGRGHLVPGEDGVRAEAQIRAGMRGISIDGIGQLPPKEQITAVDETGAPLTALLRYNDTKIMGATSLPFGAFETATIWFDDESTPERVTQTHGQQIPTDMQPEVVDTGSDDIAALIAAGAPVNPPKSWFYAPAPDSYQPVTVRKDGFISGHLGKMGTCHIGQIGTCVTIPPSETSYRYFHRTLAATAEGENVPCGWFTMDTNHLPVTHRLTAAAVSAHYENTGTQVAKIRVVDTPNGPWACGAVSPGLSEEMLWKLQGPEVSGDWRDLDGHYRELVAVLGVPLPGFLTQRPEALVASGQIVAQTGVLPCDDCGPPATVEDFPTDNGISARLAMAERLLRPAYMEALAARVSPEAMVEAARLAAEPDPSQAWRDKLHVG